MQLMTTAGAYAGQVREYPFHVARIALQTGVARPLPSAAVMPAPPRQAQVKPPVKKRRG